MVKIRTVINPHVEYVCATREEADAYLEVLQKYGIKIVAVIVEEK